MTYNLDIINLFINKYINKEKLNDISYSLNIHVQTLYRWIKLYNLNNNKEPIRNRISIKNNGSRNKIINNILLYVNNNIGCTLKDIYYNINKKVSISTICRILKENNITHKKINNQLIFKSLEKIEEERKKFSKSINKQKLLNAIYIDESSFCINDVLKYGYSLKGNKIKITKHSKNKERYTLLMAISYNKIECYKVVKNSVDSGIYMNFLKENTNIFKNRNIYQDNARIHHACIVKNYTINNNINMFYNPAYTPEFNPIEIIFSKLKTLYRKLNHCNITNDINHIINKVTINDLNNCFNHSIDTILNYI